jgi:hypothetical protein
VGWLGSLYLRGGDITFGRALELCLDRFVVVLDGAIIQIVQEGSWAQ